MPTISIESADLYFEEQGAGPALICLHGVGGNRASWFQQVVHWRASFRVITPDARGFGRSVDKAGLGRAAFADDIGVLMDHLGLDRATLVAQSMGGGAAVDFACRHADRIDGLVIADSLAWLAAPNDMAADFKAHTAKAAALSQVERVLGPVFRDAEPELTELYLQLARFNRYNFRDLPGEHALYSPEQLGALGKPVLFVAGRDDVLFPCPMIEEISRRTRGAEFAVIEGAGHSAYFERPAEFDAALRPFLDSLHR